MKNKKPLALIIDDEPDIRELLRITLERMDLACKLAPTLQGAYALLEKHTFDICLIDLRLPDGNGLELLAYINTRHLRLPAIVITAHGNMESSIQALKSGAFDFLSKPVELEVLRSLIRSALKLGKTTTKNKEASLMDALIGKTAMIENTKKTIAKLVRSQAPVYISGESGTGKELIAKIIHQQSVRSASQFVPVNCGAIPSELMESELFGHVKGSFTGAIEDKEGLFQTAEGGTLFFDEIAELPVHMQVKLLRAIQEKSVRPVGGTRELPIDVRILSATHQKLEGLVEQGRFRQDLFYRVNVIEINIPPLRERTEDIPLLIDYKLKQLLADRSLIGKENITLAKDALDALCRYHFPGNVRELENILERAITFCETDLIHEADLQLPASEHNIINTMEKEQSLDSYLHKIEKQTIVEALEKTRWNKTAAAKLLGISFRALRYRLQKLNLD